MIFFPNLIVNNNDAYLQHRINLNTDRYSLYLYNTYNSSVNTASRPPTIEEYGCVMPPPDQQNAGGTSIPYFSPSSVGGNSFSGFARTLQICPSYQGSKLFPVAYNPNNFLVSQIGVENLTWYSTKLLATPFINNGFHNASTGSNNFGPDCRYSSPLKVNPYYATGYENGPRSFIISRNVLISASHYWGNPVGNNIQFMGSDNSIHTATVTRIAKALPGDVILMEVTGLEEGIDSGVLKPISTFNWDTEYDLRYLLIYAKMLPMFQINMDGMIGLLDEHIIRSKFFSNSGLYTLYDFFNFQSLFPDYCSVTDFNLYGGAGTSSSPFFLLHENTPILVKTRETASDYERCWDMDSYNAIDLKIQEWGASPRNKITIPFETILNKINMFKTLKSNTNNIFLKTFKDIEIYENTNGNIRTSEQENKIFVLQNINNVNDLTFNTMCKIDKPNREIYTHLLSLSGCAFLRDNNNKKEDDGIITSFIRPLDCSGPVEIGYNLYSSESLNCVDSILNSQIYLYSETDLQKFYENYYLNNKIIIQKNKKYYITLTLDRDSNVGNKFYFSVDKNNKQKIYNKNIFKYKNLYFDIDPAREFFVSKNIENLYDQELPKEILPQPFNVDNYNLKASNMLNSCPDANGLYDNQKIIQTALADINSQYTQQLFTIIFDVPEDCPSKLYLCFEDSPDSYIEIYCEPSEIPSMKKNNTISYLNITPTYKVEQFEKIKINGDYTNNTGIGSSEMQTSLLTNWLNCYESWDPDDPTPTTFENFLTLFDKYFLFNVDNAFFDPAKDFIKQRKKLKYGITSNENYDININREE